MRKVLTMLSAPADAVGGDPDVGATELEALVDDDVLGVGAGLDVDDVVGAGLR